MRIKLSIRRISNGAISGRKLPSSCPAVPTMQSKTIGTRRCDGNTSSAACQDVAKTHRSRWVFRDYFIRILVMNAIRLSGISIWMRICVVTRFVYFRAGSRYSNNNNSNNRTQLRKTINRARRMIGIIRTIRTIRRLRFPRKRATSLLNKSKMAVPVNNRPISCRRSAATKCYRRCDVEMMEIWIAWVSWLYIIIISYEKLMIKKWIVLDLMNQFHLFHLFSFTHEDENVIGLSLQEILPDNNNIKTEKMLVANPPNILKRAKSMKMENAVSELQRVVQSHWFCWN